MKSLFREILAVLAAHRRGLVIFSAVCLGVMIVAASIAKYQTTQPSFCRSCHYMNPYVRHWESSTHSDVSCVKCHDYGLARLTISTIKYVTKTYDSRPKANVHDESCLDSDCHSTEQLAGPLKYRNNIMFDHATHRGKPVRGETLRCTSCHNQIVQYGDDKAGHMTVNDKSCFVCHFKDAGRGEASTGCNSCHGIPEQEVTHAGFTFDHKPYLELGVECKQCHVSIVRGDGSVPESRCHDCHIERSTQDLGREELHDIHVTDGGIDCYKCHSDIEHGNFTMVSSLEVECESCHLRQHNRPRQLYMGIGGRNGRDHPSSMFTAQVSCTGCHTHVTPEGEVLADQDKKEATRNSCVTCHGDGYDGMFDNWISGSKRVLTDYRAFIKKAKKDLKQISGGKKALVKARAALSQAEFNYNFVRDGKMSHNIQYAVHLLNSAVADFESAMQQVNNNYKAPPAGDGLNPNNVCQIFCHGQATFSNTVDYDGDELPHTLHVEDMELSCNSCHDIKEHGTTAINEEVCSECH